MPFFHLGLFGDDWLSIFRYSYYLDTPKHLGTYSTEYFNNFKYFFNAYGSQDTIMALLYKSFGPDSNIYFVLAYILRLSAGISIYLPIFYITKNRLASFFGVFFFIFSAVGLDASGWVFNMPSYLMIIFFNCFLYNYFKYYKEHQIKNLVFTYIFFFLSFSSTMIRSHGLLPLIVFIELIWLIPRAHWNSTKQAVLRIIGFFLIFALIYYLGFKETLSGNALISVSGGFTTAFHLLSQGRFDFLFYPIATIGSLLIPDSLIPGWEITSTSQYLVRIVIPIICIYLAVVIILSRTIKNLSSKFIITNILVSIIWSIIVAMIYKFNLSYFTSSSIASLTLIGGLLIELSLTLVIFIQNHQFIKFGILVALGWTFISFLFPWWTTPNYLFLTSHRYLIVSGLGVSYLLATIMALSKNLKSILVLIIIGITFTLPHALYIRSYMQKSFYTHNRAGVKKIWSQMPYIPEVGKSTEPIVFYFERDDTNAAILGDSVTFGFPFHTAIIYKITEENKTPIPMTDWKELVSAVTDGKSFAPYTGGKVTKPISPQRVYSFRLMGKDNLSDITDEVRQKLVNLTN